MWSIRAISIQLLVIVFGFATGCKSEQFEFVSIEKYDSSKWGLDISAFTTLANRKAIEYLAQNGYENPVAALTEYNCYTIPSDNLEGDYVSIYYDQKVFNKPNDLKITHFWIRVTKTTEEVKVYGGR